MGSGRELMSTSSKTTSGVTLVNVILRCNKKNLRIVVYLPLVDEDTGVFGNEVAIK